MLLSLQRETAMCHLSLFLLHKHHVDTAVQCRAYFQGNREFVRPEAEVLYSPASPSEDLLGLILKWEVGELNMFLSHTSKYTKTLIHNAPSLLSHPQAFYSQPELQLKSSIQVAGILSDFLSQRLRNCVYVWAKEKDMEVELSPPPPPSCLVTH